MGDYYNPENFRYGAGGGNASSFMVAGRPYVTGGIVPSSSQVLDGVYIQFPMVVKSFTVYNTDEATDFVVHFVSRTNPTVMTGHHYITVKAVPGTSDAFVAPSVRCKELYISVAPGSTSTGSYEMFAEMTTVVPENMIVTGSGVVG